MGYLTLLVHVDVTSEGRQRLELAIELAQRFGARLIGVGAQSSPDWDSRVGADQLLREMLEKDLREAEEIFRKAAQQVPDTKWYRKSCPPVAALSETACGADLIVGSRTAQVTDPGWFARADELVLSAGTPVLLQPPQLQHVEARHIVIGWKNTREARHAIWAGLPFLLAAERVTLVRFTPSGEEEESLQAVAERLQRHGVKLASECRQRLNATVAQDLIAAAEQLRADMIVAGGYGHSRTRELMLGGVTRGLLSQAPCHLLLCH